MDLSRLPKLSETPKPADNDRPMPEPGVLDYRGPGISESRIPISAGEVWFAMIVGSIFILLSKSFPIWLISRLAGKPFPTGVIWSVGPKAGQPVEYWELQGHTALSDMSIFLFGVAVIIESLMYLVWLKRPTQLKAVAQVALAVTILATALNLMTSALLSSAGIMPLLSLMAAAFGGWMFVQQRGLLTWVREATQARNPSLRSQDSGLGAEK